MRKLLVILPFLACTSVRVPQSDAAQTLRQWRDALRRGDARAAAALVTPDAEFWTHDAPPTRGRDALVAAFDGVFAAYEMDQEFTVEETIACGEWTLLRGMERNVLTEKKSGKRTEIRQRAFSVLHRDADGRWRFARGITNRPPDAVKPLP